MPPVSVTKASSFFAPFLSSSKVLLPTSPLQPGKARLATQTTARAPFAAPSSAASSISMP
jgi:hypothetical protein